jgi:hypothetical protein
VLTPSSDVIPKGGLGEEGAVLACNRSVYKNLARGGYGYSISPGGIVTGIFAKNVGVEGSPAMKINGTVRDVFATLQPLAQSGETDYIANTGLFPEQGRSAGRGLEVGRRKRDAIA